MPYQNGVLTSQERVFAEAYSRTNDKDYARQQAGWSKKTGAAEKALQRPGVQAEIAKHANQRLHSDILPLALEWHERLLRDPSTPANTRLGAVKLAYDRTLGAQDGGERKDPSEMTADELQQAIERLRQEAGNRAKTIEAKADGSPETGAFD